MKFITNVTILGLGRGSEFETDLTEYLAGLVGSKVISVIQEKAAARAPVDTGVSASRQRSSAPRKRTGGTGTRKRAAKKAGGSSDAV